jgi:hypothetical protein
VDEAAHPVTGADCFTGIDPISISMLLVFLAGLLALLGHKWHSGAS